MQASHLFLNGEQTRIMLKIHVRILITLSFRWKTLARFWDTQSHSYECNGIRCRPSKRNIPNQDYRSGVNNDCGHRRHNHADPNTHDWVFTIPVVNGVPTHIIYWNYTGFYSNHPQSNDLNSHQIACFGVSPLHNVLVCCQNVYFSLIGKTFFSQQFKKYTTRD